MTWGKQKPFLGARIETGHPLAPDGCWLLNERGGTTVFDLSGNLGSKPFDGTWAPDGCLFTTDEKINLGDAFDFTTSSNFTIVARMVGGSSGFRTLLARRNGGSYQYQFRQTSTNYLSFLASNGSVNSTTLRVLTGEVATVGLVWDGSGAVTFHKNSEFQTTGSGLTISSRGIDCTIGNQVDGTHPHQNIRWMYVYNRALSEADLSSLHNSPYQFIRADDFSIYMGQGGGAAPASIIPQIMHHRKMMGVS